MKLVSIGPVRGVTSNYRAWVRGAGTPAAQTRAVTGALKSSAATTERPSAKSTL
jgi:hypothetical protein